MIFSAQFLNYFLNDFLLTVGVRGRETKHIIKKTNQPPAPVYGRKLIVARLAICLHRQINPRQHRCRYMRVYLRRPARPVPGYFLYYPQIGSRFKQPGKTRVAQGVKMILATEIHLHKFVAACSRINLAKLPVKQMAFRTILTVIYPQHIQHSGR